jgi:hypothetical protein
LGNSQSHLIIQEALRPIASLYKFPGSHFSGYPIRWDAVISDRWTTRDTRGQHSLMFCCEFLLASDRRSHLYCTPFQDPRYTPFARSDDIARLTQEQKSEYHEERIRSLVFHRAWEPSLDELHGQSESRV